MKDSAIILPSNNLSGREMEVKKFALPKVSDYERKLCADFSVEAVKVSYDHYKKRNNADKSKIQNDIFYGKLAEVMVFKLFKSHKKPITAPDFMIYDADAKSFEADFLSNGKNVHVKSCLADSFNSNSWVFQITDPLVKNPQPPDFLMLCILAEVSYGYLLRAVDGMTLLTDLVLSLIHI